MAGEKGPKPQADSARRERLSQQLRDNLARRKAQIRARRAGEPDRRGEGITAAEGAGDEADDTGGRG